MSHYVTDLDGERKPRKPPDRELDAIEVRILGSLAEKQMAINENRGLADVEANSRSDRDSHFVGGQIEPPRNRS